MVEMHMGDHQGLDTLHYKVRRQRTRPRGRLGALLQATIHQQTGSRIQMEPVAGPCYATSATVMGDTGELHRVARSPGC